MPITEEMIDYYTRMEEIVRERQSDTEFTVTLTVWDDDDFWITFTHIDGVKAVIHIYSYKKSSDDFIYCPMPPKQYNDGDWCHDNLEGEEIEL